MIMKILNISVTLLMHVHVLCGCVDDTITIFIKNSKKSHFYSSFIFKLLNLN